MALAELRDRFGPQVQYYERDCYSGEVCLTEADREELGRQPLCFGMGPGTAGFANFTQVWFDGEGKAGRIEGANIGSDDVTLGREVWSSDPLDLRRAYPFFIDDFEKARNGRQKVNLDYSRAGLRVTAGERGPYWFSLRKKE